MFSWKSIILLFGIVGCGIEMTLSHFGHFQYLRPNVWGIPIWLPMLYAAASIGVGNWARKLKKTKMG